MANSSFFSVTPSDASALQQPVWWLYVGVTGDLAVFGPGDTTATVVKAAPVGWMRFPSQVVKVGSTGTTATNIAASTGDQMASH
jgi:hypothetical protein